MSTTETGTDDRPRRRFDRSRLRLGIVIAVIAGGLAFLVLQVGDSTTYFYNADEIASRTDELAGKSLRVQGTVVADPVSVGSDELSFEVEYHCSVVPVVHRGAPPELFKPGIPVVLEGTLTDDGTFESDRIRVHHTNEYRTDEAERLELAEREACP
jgi:cytochrome c-type biogenesis protein CcmE